MREGQRGHDTERKQEIGEENRRSTGPGSRRGRSRRSFEAGAKRGGSGGCLIGLLLILLAVTAAAAFLYVQNSRAQKRAAVRESPADVEPQVFPGDERQQEDGGAGAGENTGDTVGTGTGNLAGSGDGQTLTVGEQLQKMTLEEKVLQLFMITPEALTGVDEVYAAGSKTAESITAYPVGGIVYFRQNLRSPDQVKDMLTRTQKYYRDRIGIEAFLGVDEEGGQVTRISGRAEFGISSFPDMSTIGASGDPGKAYAVGDTIGGYLAGYGFNMDFAPVADVLTNPDNTVVARRSFGTDGARVASYSSQVVLGLQGHGVSAVLKHFPGHGGTAADSHEGYAATGRTLEELTAEDFVPFQEGIKTGVDFIMCGHIASPAVTGDNTPASLSPKMITELLRGTLGYDGIVITDALNMGAITSAYSPAEAAVKALQAGNDMLLMPENFQEAYQGVLDAVQNGTLSEARIDQSVQRILKVKLGA